jgi:hypothetical protein
MATTINRIDPFGAEHTSASGCPSYATSNSQEPSVIIGDEALRVFHSACNPSQIAQVIMDVLYRVRGHPEDFWFRR